jgi:hypothetical protein
LTSKYTHKRTEKKIKKSSRIIGLGIGCNLKFEVVTFWIGSQMTTASSTRSPTNLCVVTENLGSDFGKTGQKI